jgi:hypothetical protein
MGYIIDGGYGGRQRKANEEMTMPTNAGIGYALLRDGCVIDLGETEPTFDGVTRSLINAGLHRPPNRRVAFGACVSDHQHDAGHDVLEVQVWAGRVVADVCHATHEAGCLYINSPSELAGRAAAYEAAGGHMDDPLPHLLDLRP